MSIRNAIGGQRPACAARVVTQSFVTHIAAAARRGGAGHHGWTVDVVRACTLGHAIGVPWCEHMSSHGASRAASDFLTGGGLRAAGDRDVTCALRQFAIVIGTTVEAPL